MHCFFKKVGALQYRVFIEPNAWWWVSGRGLLPAANIILTFAKLSRYSSQFWFYDMGELMCGVFIMLIMLWWQLAWWLGDSS